MNGRITSSEVAKRAGVSQSAVSRVFTPGASASAKTVEKVRRIADEMGYRPNFIARAMVSGKSRIIGLVVAYLENQFYPEALEKLSNALQEKGYHVLIFMAGKDNASIEHVIEEILDYQVDGIVTASVALSSTLANRCRAAGVPMVLFNRSQDDTGMSAVTSDNHAGGQKNCAAPAGHRASADWLYRRLGRRLDAAGSGGRVSRWPERCRCGSARKRGWQFHHE